MALVLVPTPVGNLDDITRRAVETLQKVDFIIAEDTRHSRKLLSHLGISKPLVSCFGPREERQAEKIVPMLKEKTGALLTDSGSPGISDPGTALVRKALNAGIEVTALPGPTAFVPALTASGIPADRFLFLGFPPRKTGDLRTFLESLQPLPFTLIFYESPRRLLAFLDQCASVFGDREFAVIREISKIHEHWLRGRLLLYSEIITEEILRGELVVIVAGNIAPQRGQPSQLQMKTLDDLFVYFHNHHNLSKNQVKRIIMNKPGPRRTR